MVISLSILRLVGSQCTLAVCARTLFSKAKLTLIGVVVFAAVSGTSVKNRPFGAAVGLGASVTRSPRCLALPSMTAGLVLLRMVPGVSRPLVSLMRISVQSAAPLLLESVPPATRICRESMETRRKL